MAMLETREDRADILNRAENLLHYWGRHGDDEEARNKWAYVDLMELVHAILGDEDGE